MSAARLHLNVRLSFNTLAYIHLLSSTPPDDRNESSFMWEIYYHLIRKIAVSVIYPKPMQNSHYL